MDAAAQSARFGRLERFEAGLEPGSLRSRRWFTWKWLRSWVAHRLPRRLPPIDLRY